MAHVTILPAAREDLLDIGDFSALDNPARALSFVTEIEAIIFGKIGERPASFPMRDDLTPGLRAAVHGRYLIFFMIAAQDVQIVRILHGARDLRQAFGTA